MVEQLTLNQLVRGSSPRGATILCPLGWITLGYCFVVSQSDMASAGRLSRRSSMVEHLFCKQAVAGSNPIAGSKQRWFSSSAQRNVRQGLFTARLCNGSTTDSDSVCLGSTPSRAANLRKIHRVTNPPKSGNLPLMAAAFALQTHRGFP